MKRILLILITAVILFSMLSVNIMALSDSEVEAEVSSQGKAGVTGNLLIWFLCAVAFLKVSQKIDTFMSSLGINVGQTGGNMLGELMIAFKTIKSIGGGASGSGGNHGSSSNTSTNNTFLSGGLAGSVGRTFERNAASSVTNQSNHTISQKLYNSSVSKGGSFANTIIGNVAKGEIKSNGTISGNKGAEAMTSYFGYAGKANAPKYSDVEIGGGRIMGKESIGGAAPTEFAMYNAEQYMKPEGNFTTETAKDGSKWYKQTPVDTVRKTPYMDASGDIKYNEELVKELPQIPRRRDRV